MREAVIAGVAESDLGKVAEGLTPVDLMAQAAKRALDECGLEVADVDGLFAATTQLPMATLNLGEYLGINPRYTDATQIGGSSFVAHLHHAQAAVAAGMCEVALIAYGSTQRSVGRAVASVQEISPWEAPYRPMLPVTGYALAASRHMHEFGTTREQLAEVAVSAREWARLNPKAWHRDPLTIEDVLSSRPIAEPLHRDDICLVTDGGGALILTTAERARDAAKKPIRVIGAGESHSHWHVSQMPDLTVSAGAVSGREAFSMAGITPDDVDFIEPYDSFTITVLMALEDLGFCAKGEGGAFVEGGTLAPGGKLPAMTSGGGLSYCHPGALGLLLLVEAVRQLRGEAGERQVPDARIGVAHGVGGMFSTAGTVVMARD